MDPKSGCESNVDLLIQPTDQKLIQTKNSGMLYEKNEKLYSIYEKMRQEELKRAAAF